MASHNDSVKNCKHGLQHVDGCGECHAYARMYRLDHKTTLAPGEGKELKKLEKYFFPNNKG